MEADFEQSNYQLKKSKWDRVNPVSKIFFLWLWPLYYKAFRQNKLQFEDVYECPPEDKSQNLANKLEIKWQEQLTKQKIGKTKAKFIWALFHCFLFDFIPIVLSYLFQELIVRVGQAYLLGNVIIYFSEEHEEQQKALRSAILSAVGFVVCAAVGATMNHFNITLTDHVGIRMKTACTALIYKKTLQLSQKSVHLTSVGQVSNLMANDVNRMIDYAYFAHSPIVATLQLAIVTYLLWRELSWSCFPGLAILFLFIPVQGVMGKLFQSVRSKTAPLTDKRIRIISEIVSGIKLIKMYAWERAFIKIMSESRIKEVNQIRKSCYLKGMHLSMYYVTSRIVLFVCFIVYIYLYGGVLTAYKVFVTMALFNVIRIPVTRHLPQSIAATAELTVACQRIQKYLLLEQVDFNIPEESNIANDSDNQSVILENASASWDEDDACAFNNVNITLNKGELLTVVGPVGCGKTSLLMSLMQELPLNKESKMNTFGAKIAYVPQKAWIFMGTIRENILFGSPFEEARFWKVVKAAALDEDFSSMPKREMTLVGEKGYKLSGGQKARINLARALYADADLYLLDDPISALDVKVAKLIVQRCLLDYLKDKTTILVTHQVQFIPPESSVLILDKMGHTVQFVRHNQAERKDLEESLLKDYCNDDLDDEQKEEEDQIQSDDQEHLDEDSSKQLTEKLNQDISKQTGPYTQYFKAGFHFFNFVLMLLSIVISQTLSQGSDYLLSLWTEAFTHNSTQIDLYAYIYTGLIVALFFSTLVRATSFFTFCMSASTKLYNQSFARVVQTPIEFFFKNPSGRILNRFSRDIGQIDDYIPMTAFELKMSITDVIATLIIEIIVDWRFVFPAVVFLVFMQFFSVIYMRTAREVKRLEAIARNPIFSHINTTFDGLTLIRCFEKQTYFENLYYKFQDFHTSVYFSHICASRGFAIVIEWLCVLYIGAITTTIMLSIGLSSSLIGLSLSSCILLVGVTSWGVECRADLESYMSSVERVSEYTRLCTEFDLKKPINRKQTIFPNGKIDFQDVSLSYDPNNPVLQHLNFTINTKEKIGIVGRTGAGKSSIITALFRLVEPNGHITIDDLDIGKLNLELLRANISTIPQDPVLFTGSIRTNIDLFDQFTDQQLWQALEEVQLKDFLAKSNKTLDSQVQEGGSNFSVGQRQLLCLARAMLQKNRILILDEATSNLDHQTDQAIQQVIRDKFVDSTVITVAHRLNTIIDCDQVMVLDSGRLIEFGNPHSLLLRDDSTFASLVDKTGEKMSQELRNVAKSVYFAKYDQ